MVTKAAINDFLSQEKLAVVGISRNSKKMGNAIFEELTKKKYKVYPVHPQAETLEGARCYPSLSALPEAVGGVVVVVPPEQTEVVIRDAHQAGIRKVWLQQGAESPKAIEFCEQNGMSVIHGECILMYAEPQESIHKFHRWVKGIFGKLPK